MNSVLIPSPSQMRSDKKQDRGEVLRASEETLVVVDAHGPREPPALSLTRIGTTKNQPTTRFASQ